MSVKTPVLRLFTLFAMIPVAFGQAPTRKEPATFQGGTEPLPRPQPPSFGQRLTRPLGVSLGSLTTVERARFNGNNPKRRVGVHRELAADATLAGSWTALTDGRRIWRMSIRSSGAAGVRLQFSNFSVGAGRVWIHSGASVDGPYTGDGPYGNGEFWTSTIDGEIAILEYEPATATRREDPPPFQIHRVAHQMESVTSLPPQTDVAAACTVDVNCYPAWAETKKSVAHIIFEVTDGDEQGEFQCSGTAIGTRTNSFKPYFLTAGHCINTESSARSLQTFWAHESAGCNQGPPPTLGSLKSSNGGHLLASASFSEGDFSLVMLPDIPQGVVFAGWDPDPLPIGTKVVGVSHPRGSYKRISFGESGLADDVAVTEGKSLIPAPGQLYTEITFSNGVVQPGSSGSAIFNQPGVIVGIASYSAFLTNQELCDLTNSTAGYGRFSVAYPVLKDFLEDLPGAEVFPSLNSLNFTGQNRAINGSSSQSFTLTTASTVPVTYKVRGDPTPWLQVSPDTGKISASTPVKVTVTVDPKFLVTAGTYTSTLTVLTGAAPPVFVNVSVSMKVDVSNVTVTAIPNPVPQSGSTWALKLHIAETNGTSTTLTGFKIDGVDYSAQIPAFFGGAKIAALGALDATLHTTGIVTPATKYFEFFGKDDVNGTTWYREIAVTFTN